MHVPAGTVLGLLGPNGAGKTTVLRILTTLLKPDSGQARVAGCDVVAQPQVVRSMIGLTGQYAAVDEQLTGWENLTLVGRLSRLDRAATRRRSAEFVERFGLADVASRRVSTYSGGMRRRLDLCASLLADPKVLFLDEPTTGLDPRNRLELWDVIADLRRRGTTVILTTQYLEEADHLADWIAVLDGGRLIAEGTADELKTRSGGAVLAVSLADRTQTAGAAAVLSTSTAITPIVDVDTGELRLPLTTGAVGAVDALQRLDAAGISLAHFALRHPSLDDVFLALTGRDAPDDANGITTFEVTPSRERIVA